MLDGRVFLKNLLSPEVQTRYESYLLMGSDGINTTHAAMQIS